MNTIIGRQREQELFQDILESTSKESFFLAVYGPPKIGKTYLVKNYFQGKGVFFYLAGIQDGTLKIQLQNFANVFSACFRNGEAISRPKSWLDAFDLLRREVEQAQKGQKVILIFDELSWLNTPRSRIFQNLNYTWDRYFARTPNIILVVCGYDYTCMIDQYYKSKGGLYGRVSRSVLL